jgi:hypothetical protein
LLPLPVRNRDDQHDHGKCQERRSVRSRHGVLCLRYGSRNAAGPGGGWSHW